MPEQLISRPTLKNLTDRDSVVYLPGVWDGLSARVAERAGYGALFSSGMAIAASLGMPDADVYTMTENLDAVRRIHEASRLPILADIDHGYGGPLNVIRTVRLFEASGAQGIIIEDQASPKRCPVCVDDAVALVTVQVAAARVRAAYEATQRADTIIVARTDASGDDALRRAEAYAAAGADFIFPVSKTFSSAEQWEACSHATGLPLLACLTSGTWVERDFDDATMRQIGVKLALLPFQALYAGIHAMDDALRRIHSGEPPASISKDYFAHERFKDFIGFAEAIATEKAYSVSTDCE